MRFDDENFISGYDQLAARLHVQSRDTARRIGRKIIHGLGCLHFTSRRERSSEKLHDDPRKPYQATLRNPLYFVPFSCDFVDRFCGPQANLATVLSCLLTSVSRPLWPTSNAGSVDGACESYMCTVPRCPRQPPYQLRRLSFRQRERQLRRRQRPCPPLSACHGVFARKFGDDERDDDAQFARTRSVPLQTQSAPLQKPTLGPLEGLIELFSYFPLF